MFLYMNTLHAADDVGTPTVYQITMKKVELCIDPGCSVGTVLAEKDGTFNIASATAGADVGSWITGFNLEVGTPYTHIRATLSTTFTIAGYTTNTKISSDNCLTATSPSTASAVNQGPIVSGSDSTDGENMTFILPNTLNANNGNPYSDLYNSYTTNGIKRVKDATTFTWTGALTNTYTPTATSKPKITIKFDVTNMLKSSQQAANACFMWIESPSVSVAVSD